MFRNLAAAATTTLLRHHSTTTGVGLYFRRARSIDHLRLLLRRHLPLPSPPTTDPFVAGHALRSAPSASSALSLFLSLPTNLRSSPEILLYLFRHLPTSLLLPFLPSLPPLVRLRLLSSSGDATSTFRCFRHLQPSTEAYNLLLSVYIKNHMHEDALQTFLEMVLEKEMIPNSRTYTLIMEHLLLIGNLDDARKVFDKIPMTRMHRTTRQYEMLSNALSLSGRFEELMRLIDDMRRDGLLPGRVMRASMLRLRELGLGEEMLREFEVDLFPDARIGYVVDDASGENHTTDCVECGEVKLKQWVDPYLLARALKCWDVREVEALEGLNLVWTSRLVCKVLRGFKKADSAWKYFQWVAGRSGDFAHDRYTISRMMTLLARSGREELVEELISKAKTNGIRLPFSTIRKVVELYGVSKRPEAASRVFEDADEICGHITNLERRLLCSSLLHTLVKCKKDSKAMHVLGREASKGNIPDEQTLSGMMEFYSRNGDLEAVLALFRLGRQCKVELDALVYQVLIQAYINNGRTTLALRMFEDMRNLNMVPSAITKRLLVSRLWREGRRREVAYVEERSEEAGNGHHLAVLGHVWTTSAADLRWICSIYSKALSRVNSEAACSA